MCKSSICHGGFFLVKIKLNIEFNRGFTLYWVVLNIFGNPARTVWASGIYQGRGVSLRMHCIVFGFMRAFRIVLLPVCSGFCNILDSPFGTAWRIYLDWVGRYGAQGLWFSSYLDFCYSLSSIHIIFVVLDYLLGHLGFHLLELREVIIVEYNLNHQGFFKHCLNCW